MTSKESRAATRIVELSTDIQNKLDELAKLVSDSTHDLDYKLNDELLEVHFVKLSDVANRLRIRSTSVANMIDVLRSVQYVKEMESTFPKGDWLTPLKNNEPTKAVDILRQFKHLSNQEVHSIVGFFLMPRV